MIRIIHELFQMVFNDFLNYSFSKNEICFIFISVERLIHKRMCWFPGAAVTKYHKLDALEQQKCIVSHFWRLEVYAEGVSNFRLLRVVMKNCSMTLYKLLAIC